MTKKHFIEFARALKLVADAKLREEMLAVLLPVFRECNPRFSSDMFRAALADGTWNDSAGRKQKL